MHSAPILCMILIYYARISMLVDTRLFIPANKVSSNYHAQISTYALVYTSKQIFYLINYVHIGKSKFYAFYSLLMSFSISSTLRLGLSLAPYLGLGLVKG